MLTQAHRQRLIHARGARSQAEVAAEIGVSRPYVAMLESGAKQPSEELLLRWAKAVGLRCKITPPRAGSISLSPCRSPVPPAKAAGGS